MSLVGVSECTRENE